MKGWWREYTCKMARKGKEAHVLRIMYGITEKLNKSLWGCNVAQ